MRVKLPKLPSLSSLRNLPGLPPADGALCEPLVVREGARYECFGDGLCCTDIHAIGPIRLAERARLRLVHDGIVAHDPRDDVHVLVMRAESGTCIFLEENRCAVHEPLGGLLKPLACKQFPISLTATPAGGRITTEHKCPCRTLGERPALTVEDALPAVTQRGKLAPVARVGTTVPVTYERSVPFAEYRAEEAALMARVRAAASLDEVAQALGAPAFPALRGGSWESLVAQLGELSGNTRLEHVMRWLADAVVACTGGADGTSTRGSGAPPWRDAFERGLARSTEEQQPLAMLQDFVLDQVWAVHWIDEFPFQNFRAELATRVRLFQQLHTWLVADGLRPDQAAAEAILIVELGGSTDWWLDIARQVMLSP